MKRLTWIATGVIIGVLMSGCATMQENETHEVPAMASPDVSKTVQAQQSANKSMPTGLKYKVAIERFSNETRYGQSFFLDQNYDRIGKQALDILTAQLASTGRFLMIEHSDIKNIQEMLQQGEEAKLRNIADYVIIGSITEFGRKETSDVGVFSKVKKQEVYAKVHIRIVDVQTGEIIFSQEGNGKAYSEAGQVMGVGSTSGYDSELNDKAIDAAISDLTSNLVENMLDRPWHSYILGYEDGKFIISGGKTQNVQVGQTFSVMQSGKKVKNPQTGMMITLPGKKIGEIKIVMNLGDNPQNEVSLADLIDGDLSSYIAQKSFENLYISAKE